MRLVLAMVLAGLVALPLSVSAQDTDKGWVEEFYPELAPRESPQAPPPEPVPKEPVSEPAPEEPALQLKLDDAGVVVLGVGLIVAGAFAGECRDQSQFLPSYCEPLAAAGTALTIVGIIGMTTTGSMSLKRTRDRDWLERAHYRTPRRVQWDIARSRIVF